MYFWDAPSSSSLLMRGNKASSLLHLGRRRHPPLFAVFKKEDVLITVLGRERGILLLIIIVAICEEEGVLIVCFLDRRRWPRQHCCFLVKGVFIASSSLFINKQKMVQNCSLKCKQMERTEKKKFFPRKWET